MTTKRFMRTWGIVLGPSLALAALCGLAYWTWCWGYWGRGNPLMQYWFQCKCPAVSEQARFQPFRLIASACHYPSLEDFSQSGRYILVAESSPEQLLFRYDLETGQTLVTELRGGINRFVDDTLILEVSREGASLVDQDTGQRTPIPILEMSSFQSLDTSTRQTLQEAEQVVVFGDPPTPLLLALSNEYHQSSKQNLVIDPGGMNGYERLIQLLANEKIPYSQIPPPYGSGGTFGTRYSRGGRFWADVDGIYLADTGQRIIEAWQPGFPRYGYSPQGWVNNDRAVVYGQGGYGYLLVTDIFGNYFPVPQPILLLEVPQQYWVTPTPEP